ncbi:MAG: hypothetical protein MUO91_05330 [candidate division Zixibacteria bacterium]|nr:hypothetical protein [candidate division Zixibacteria bacterium]
MSRRNKAKGTCHLCGNFGALSFEHVPPRAAFNNRRIIKVTFEQAISLGPDEIVKGPIQQGGIGGHTLCPKCNNLTGHWYGTRFVGWCYQAMNILIRSHGKPSLIYLNYLFPLAILKQIVTMFFSVNTETFSKANPELVQFVLKREAKYLPPKYRFFMYYNTTGTFRFSGIWARLDPFSSRSTTLMSEITYPPFGYVMTIDSEPPDSRLFEITHFSTYDYNFGFSWRLQD